MWHTQKAVKEKESMVVKSIIVMTDEGTYCELAKNCANYDCEFVPCCIRCKGCQFFKTE